MFKFSFSKHFQHNSNGVFSVNIRKVMKVSKFSALIFEVYFSTTSFTSIIVSHDLNIIWKYFYCTSLNIYAGRYVILRLSLVDEQIFIRQ